MDEKEVELFNAAHYVSSLLHEALRRTKECATSREMALVRTKLQEAIMWAREEMGRLKGEAAGGVDSL